MMKTDSLRYERLLKEIEKPSRYIGQEWNSIVKEQSEDTVSIVLAFADMYEIGMSHLGIRILYNLLNADERIIAQRVFAPARDFSKALRDNKVPLCSLETHMPLCDADIVGFSLQYELGYTNVLNMLDLSGIALRAADRPDDAPIVIAGGPSAFNPEPMAIFFDAILIGDGEEATREVCLTVRDGRRAHTPRAQILADLARIEGVYVPSLYPTSVDDETGLVVVDKSSDAPYPVKRRIEFDLNRFKYPDSFPVPFCEMVHDRINIELSRGCNAGCRFCQAGVIYRPNRPRMPRTVIDTIEQNLHHTGLDEVSLTSLDVSSYPCLDAIIGQLMQRFREDTIALSLPSVRTGAISEHIAEQIQSVRKTGFTLAPEAGSQRLRDVINKNVAQQDIINAATFAFSQGWEILKLYFMIGLPTETDQDIEDIFNLSNRLSEIGWKVSPRSGNINVSISTFVPKPHTPFQWHAMNTREQIKEKQQRLLSIIKRKRKIKLKWHDADASFLEAVISRGDRRIGGVIEHAFRDGALFDAWTDEFDMDIWTTAFEACGVDPQQYVYRQYRPGARLPWSHIDTGVRESYLQDELRKSTDGTLTPPCGRTQCHGCGVCSPAYFALSEPVLESLPPQPLEERQPAEEFFVYEGSYRKTGLLRYLSNREVMNTIIRAFRRGKLRINHSCGFNPHPKCSFGPALSVGMAGLSEPIRFELLENLPSDEVISRLNEQLPDNLQINELHRLTTKPDKMETRCAYALYELPHQLPAHDVEQVRRKIQTALDAPALPYTRIRNTGKSTTKDLRGNLIGMNIDNGKIALLLRHPARSQDVIDAVCDGAVDPADLVRVRFFAEGELNEAGNLS